MGKLKDYSYIKSGYKFLNSEITAIGEVWRERDDTPKGTLRAYVMCRCSCGNEFRGRVDRLTTNDPEKSPHTCRCQKCGVGKKKLKPTSWEYKAHSTPETVRLKTDYVGKLYNGTWFCQAYDHGDKFGSSYFVCVNTETGDTRVMYKDTLRAMSHEELFNPNAPRAFKDVDEGGLGSESKGEVAVREWLEKHHVAFEQEYTFPNLRGDGHGCLRFDFKIVNRPIVIEFQGEQHYRPVDFFGGEEQFKKQKKYDDLKRAYCKRYGIILIEIPYNYTNLDDYLGKYGAVRTEFNFF